MPGGGEAHLAARGKRLTGPCAVLQAVTHSCPTSSRQRPPRPTSLGTACLRAQRCLLGAEVALALQEEIWGNSEARLKQNCCAPHPHGPHHADPTPQGRRSHSSKLEHSLISHKADI